MQLGGREEKDDAPDPMAVVQQFWKQAEAAATEAFRKADFAVKFYVGCLTALAGWLGTNHFDHASSGELLVTLGVIGSGHVANYQVRAARLHRKARQLAQAIAESARVPPELRLYEEADERIQLLRPGQAVTAAVFNVAAVAVLSLLYSALLLFDF